MSILTDTAWAFIKRKAAEPSTYAGLIVSALALGHIKPDDAVLANIETICVAVAGLLITLINERKGPNAKNAPLPPDGTAPVVTRSDGDAVVVPRSEVATNAPGAVDVSVSSDGKTVVPQPAVHRTGFGKY